MINEVKEPIKIYVVGICRNVENCVEQEIHNLIEAIGASTIQKIFIVESDSDDNTLEKLNLLGGTLESFEFESLGVLRHVIKSRSERLAHCRNRYMEYLDINATEDSFVVIADLDGANCDLNKNRFQSIWHRLDWDVVCANQKFAYFDIWALRASGWSEVDWMSEYYHLIEGGTSSRKALNMSLYSKMKKIEEKGEWIPVDSAFGGLGIYRFSVIQGLRYAGKLEEREICEHVPFNQAIRLRGGKIFIAPSLINCEQSSHTDILKSHVRIKTLIVKILKRLFSST